MFSGQSLNLYLNLNFKNYKIHNNDSLPFRKLPIRKLPFRKKFNHFENHPIRKLPFRKFPFRKITISNIFHFK